VSTQLKWYRHRVSVTKDGTHLYSFATSYQGTTADNSRRRLKRTLQRDPIFAGSRYKVGPGKLIEERRSA
jgi:hypothetical protein